MMNDIRLFCLYETTGTRAIMKLARSISFTMTALGVVLTAAGVILNLGPIVTITGMMLFVAGIVKIAMVAIWQAMFLLPHAGQPASTPVTSSRPGATDKPKEAWHEKLP
ncbi:hypothetical protein BH23CHL4_BH23CHL4_23340 [soil metagenome]